MRECRSADVSYDVERASVWLVSSDGERFVWNEREREREGTHYTRLPIRSINHPDGVSARHVTKVGVRPGGPTS